MKSEINNPAVVEEVARLTADYERALVENDVSALSNFFWNTAQALRFGVAEELYGAEEIEAFRRNRKVNFTDRKLLREQVVAIGPDLAISTLEFNVTVAGKVKHGRQSQIWVRFDELGWRIVSAHVSHKVTPTLAADADPGAAFASAASRYVGQPFDPAYSAGVALNLQIAARIAAPLLAVELPADVEPATRFIP